MKPSPINTLSSVAFTRPAFAESNSEHPNATSKARSGGWHRREQQGQQNHELRGVGQINSRCTSYSRVLAAGADSGAASFKRGDTAAHALARSPGVPADQAAGLLAQQMAHGMNDLRASNAQGDTPLHLAPDSQTKWPARSWPRVGTPISATCRVSQ
jgi:hypothetical protein